MNMSVVSEMWRSLGSQPVRGSFSARMPKSSFAEVRRVLVLHMEDEGDQENEMEDEREGGKE